jgi:hypothetical protein
MTEMYNQTIIKLERAKEFEIERIKLERIQTEEREKELKEKELKENEEKYKLILENENILNQEKKKKANKLSLINSNHNNNNNNNNNNIDNNLISKDSIKINIYTQAKQSFKETLKEFKEIRKYSNNKESKDNNNNNNPLIIINKDKIIDSICEINIDSNYPDQIIDEELSIETEKTSI